MHRFAIAFGGPMLLGLVAGGTFAFAGSGSGNSDEASEYGFFTVAAGDVAVENG